MAAIRADPQILEEHLTVEATVDASCAFAATRLAALNDSLWHFLEATVGAFDEDYEVFSQRAHAYLILRASRLVPVAAQATHHYNEGTHDVEASPDPSIVLLVLTGAQAHTHDPLMPCSTIAARPQMPPPLPHCHLHFHHLTFFV